VRRKYAILSRVLLYGGAIFVGLPIAFCRVLTHPIRQPSGHVSAPYRELSLVCEGLRLRAWLASGWPGQPAVLLVHGLGDSLQSYVDLADQLHARGHPVMLVDLRGHGGSEGTVTTLGAREREDVAAAIDRLNAESVTRDGLVAMGWSMGAVAVLRACADRDDVSAVVTESPYDTYRENVARHAWLLYRIPRWMPLIPITIALAERWAGFDADEVDVVATARRVRAPLLAIADGADPRMPESVVRRVYDAHPGPKELWVPPGTSHVSARLLPEYWPHVTAFIERHGHRPKRGRSRAPCQALVDTPHQST
jgi:pimeloyl-ACP methyl ester carboxylesterase